MVFETTLERFFDDLVVTMVFALVLERALPRVAIAQLGPGDDSYHPVRSSNIPMPHRMEFSHLLRLRFDRRLSCIYI
jgi:hypothetical protein